MERPNQFELYEYSQEKPIMYTGIGRRLPSTPISSTQILTVSKTAPATTNSSPVVTKLMNNSVNSERHFTFPHSELVIFLQ